MIRDVVRWEDQLVNAFDENTKELYKYAGTYREVCYKVLEESDERTQFWHGVKFRNLVRVDRERW